MPFNFQESAEKLDPKSFVDIYNFAVNVWNDINTTNQNSTADDIVNSFEVKMSGLSQPVLQRLCDVYTPCLNLSTAMAYIGSQISIVSTQLLEDINPPTKDKKAKDKKYKDKNKKDKDFKNINVDPKQNTFFQLGSTTRVEQTNEIKSRSLIVGKAFDLMKLKVMDKNNIDTADVVLKELIEYAQELNLDPFANALMCVAMIYQNLIKSFEAKKISLQDFLDDIEIAKDKLDELIPKDNFATRVDTNDIMNKLISNLKAKTGTPLKAKTGNADNDNRETDHLISKEELPCCTPCCNLL